MMKEKSKELCGIVWKINHPIYPYPLHLLITKNFYLLRKSDKNNYDLEKNTGSVICSYDRDLDTTFWHPLYDKAEVMRCVIGGYDYIKEKYGRSTEERNMPEVPK